MRNYPATSDEPRRLTRARLPVPVLVVLLLVFSVAGQGHRADPNPPPNPDPANITKCQNPKAPTTAAVGGEEVLCVFPTAKETTDPGNIQWAVDNVKPGGTVWLAQYAKGTSDLTPFRFDDFTHVNFLRDVTIRGEVTSREDGERGVKQGTTVYGGQQTFYVGRSARDSVSRIQPSVSIKDIRFEGAAPGPIKFNAGKGLNEVVGCSIMDYRYGRTVGGSITGAFPIIADPIPEGPDALTGTFNVLNNYIGAADNSKTSPHYDPNLNNIMHISNANLNLTISNNKIDDAYWVAVAVFGNIGKTRITHNEITKSHSRTYEGAAISVGVSNPLFFRADAYDGSTTISDNKITLSSYNSSGIVLLIYPASQYSVTVPGNLKYEVSNNLITVKDDPAANKGNEKAALACIGACSNTVWTNNTVMGIARYGILVTKSIPTFAKPLDDGGFPQKNTFKRNNLKDFTATEAQLLIDQFSMSNTFTNSEYGPVASGGAATAGAVVKGDFNDLTNETFAGDYPGKSGTPDVVAVLLDYKAGADGYASENNKVTALKVEKTSAVPPSAAQPCEQIRDMNLEINGTTTNKAPGCIP